MLGFWSQCTEAKIGLEPPGGTRLLRDAGNRVIRYTRRAKHIKLYGVTNKGQISEESGP